MEKEEPGQSPKTALAPPEAADHIIGSARWPKIAYELALGVDDAATIAARYALSAVDMRALLQHPVFQRILQEAMTAVRESGAGYKEKAKVIAEDLLPDLYHIAKNPQVHPSIRVDTAKFLTEVAGLKPSRAAEGGALTGGTKFALQVFIGTKAETLEAVVDVVPSLPGSVLPEVEPV